MSQFRIKQGETFLAAYDHGQPLTGVTVSSSVRCGAEVFELTFTVTDAAAGTGTLSAATGAWPVGHYLWDVKSVAGGVTSYSDETLRFEVVPAVTP
jgi:hypothetical protein